MPEYVYLCPQCDNERVVIHHMRENPDVYCTCGHRMHRRPLRLAVNWNGLPPSRGELHPNLRRLIDDAPRRRDEEVIHE